MSNTEFLIFKIIFLGAGIGMLIGAGFVYQNTYQFIHSASIAQGQVVELMHSTSDSSEKGVYNPKVRFQTNEDQVILFTSSSGSNPPAYAKGEIIEVLYPPRNPEEAKINDFFPLWGDVLIMGFIGGVFTFIGICLLSIKSPKEKALKP